MHALVYSSRAVGTDRAALRDILVASRARNLDADVTGCLLYSGHAFLQVLEGEEDDVREIFARILDDARHTDLRVLVDEEVAARGHGDWSMGFAHLDEEEGLDDAEVSAALVDPAVARGLLRRCGAREDVGRSHP